MVSYMVVTFKKMFITFPLKNFFWSWHFLFPCGMSRMVQVGVTSGRVDVNEAGQPEYQSCAKLQ